MNPHCGESSGDRSSVVVIGGDVVVGGGGGDVDGGGGEEKYSRMPSRWPSSHSPKGRHHPYRRPRNYPAPPYGGGEGFPGRGSSLPDLYERRNFSRLFIGNVPRTTTEDERTKT